MRQLSKVGNLDVEREAFAEKAPRTVKDFGEGMAALRVATLPRIRFRCFPYLEKDGNEKVASFRNGSCIVSIFRERFRGRVL